MINDDFLTMLRCPETRESLSRAEEPLVQALNRAVRAAKLRNRAGKLVTRTFDGALLRADRQILYPIFDRIPILLVDEAIRLDQIALLPGANP